jgi:hypothetical protein
MYEVRVSFYITLAVAAWLVGLWLLVAQIHG